jgi:cytidylate kinase
MTVAAEASSGKDAGLAGDAVQAPRLVITIDGPAGTGKSTVAERLAAGLGLEVLDTGAMYRAVSLAAVRDGADPADETAVLSVLDRHSIDVDTTSSPFLITIDGTSPGRALRGPEVEAVVSIIAAHPQVRARLVELQRAVAARHPRLVTEGRDQGSVVFPDATIRFYLTASARTRAERRVMQIQEHGGRAGIAEIQAGIESRDRLDASRADAPLIRPDGAIEVDTDELSLDAVVERMFGEVRERLESPRDGDPGPC